MKTIFVSLALVAPGVCVADSPFAGTWVMQPELTTFQDRPMDVLIERGTYKRSDCSLPLELPANGIEQPVKDQPLFDQMSVRLVNKQRVEVLQKMAGKPVWKGLYAVSKDQRSMDLEFDDERASKPVTGVIRYVRVGDPLSAAHALSGRWQPEKLAKLSENGSTMIIRSERQGVAINWSDGRSVESPLDAKYYPLNGYLPGAQVSILQPRPDMLAINREQGIVPVEVARAVTSDDGQTLTYKQMDWICHTPTVYVYRKKREN